MMGSIFHQKQAYSRITIPFPLSFLISEKRVNRLESVYSFCAYHSLIEYDFVTAMLCRMLSVTIMSR